MMEESKVFTEELGERLPVFNQRNCLFCLNPCVKWWEVWPGAGSNTSLQLQLQQYFILRKILNVNPEWYVGALEKWSGPGNATEALEDVPEFFRVCQICMETTVNRAWELHQKMLALEDKLREIRLRTIERMKQHVTKGRINDKWSGDGLESDIYKVLFPSATDISLETRSVVKEECDMNREPDFDFLDASSLHASDSDSDSSYKPANVPTNRRRGRPPGRKPKSANSSVDPSSTSSLNPVIRKRGRPAGSKTKNFIKRKAPTTSGLLKRRRGRPRVLVKALPKRKPKSERWQHCPQCSAKFLKPILFQMHLEAHKICHDFICPQCNFPAFTSEELANHIRIRHEVGQDIRQCSECNFEGTVRKLQRHMQQEHPEHKKASRDERNIMCSSCSKMFRTKYALIIHQKKMHPEMFGEAEKVYCNQCGLPFESHIRLEYHLKNTHLRVNRFVCDTCGKGFRYRRDMELHLLVHSKEKGPFICPTCGLDFKHEASMLNHLDKFHKPGDEKQEEFQCKYCEFKSPLKPLIRRHMKEHVMDLGQNKCEICGNCYTSPQGLKRHMDINHGSKSVSCSFCLKEFPHEEYLRTHQMKFCKMKEGGVVPSTITTTTAAVLDPVLGNPLKNDDV